MLEFDKFNQSKYTNKFERAKTLLNKSDLDECFIDDLTHKLNSIELKGKKVINEISKKNTAV